MEDKQINRWLRHKFAAVGWILLGYYALVNILVIVTAMADALSQILVAFASGEFSMMVNPDLLMGNAWGYIVASILALVILFAWKGSDWRREIFQKNQSMKIGTFLCLLCLLSGAQLLNGIWISLVELVLNFFGSSALELLEQVSGSSDTFSMFLYSVVLAPIVEEVLFRGYVLRTLRPFGKRFAIFGSAFLFAIFHGNLLQTPYAYLAGLVLGYMAVEYSLSWAIGLHLFNNLVLADIMTRLLNLLHPMTADLLSLLIFGSFTAAAVVILTAKRHEVQAYREEGMDRRCLKWFFFNSGVALLTVYMLSNMISMF